jgi:putative ABC transport system ATP-binding protein
MQAILEARGVAKIYRSNGVETQAVRGVDMTIAAGEFVALMGSSGCGKSTLLHLLSGLDRPTAGEVYLGGQRVDPLGEAAWAVLRRRQIGIVFQFFNLINNLTVADNVELPALLAGASTREARASRKALLAKLGLGHKAGTVPPRLSGGQQQRVALARALVNRPALLLADEPTGNLDSQSAAEVLELLRRAHEEGQGILMVTHDPRIACAAGRVLHMRDGQIVGETSMNGSHSLEELIGDVHEGEVQS